MGLTRIQYLRQQVTSLLCISASLDDDAAKAVLHEVITDRREEIADIEQRECTKAELLARVRSRSDV
jgi:hypothetical protein